MKFIAIILSFYLLALQAVPCNDDDVTIGNDSQTISVVDFDNDHDDDCEICSPFCQCQCCHTPVINTQNFFTESEHKSIIEEIISKELNISQEVLFRVLQPPQDIG